MSRERLMAEQRRRMEERRKRLKSIKEAAKKAAESKSTKTAPAKVKGIGPVKDGATYARKLKNSKTSPTGIGPVKSGAAYARSLTKGKSAPATKAAPQPASKKSAGPVTTKTNKVPQCFADGGKGGKYDKAVNKQKAIRNFSQSASGTRGKSLPSDPKLKSQSTKPKRSSFPAGRQGASAYSAALEKYNKSQERIKRNMPKKTYDRRGRST